MLILDASLYRALAQQNDANPFGEMRWQHGDAARVIPDRLQGKISVSLS